MKICIIGLPRCGTTALYFFIKEHLSENYICENEPWNTKRNVEFTDNCFYKLVINDTVVNQLKEGETIYDFTNEIINTFDKIIYIRRKEIDGMVKSLAHQLVYRYQNYDFRQNFAKEYYKRWIPIFDELTKDKQVYYYEDLYTENVNNFVLDICKYLGVDFNESIWNKHLNKKNRKPYEEKNKNKLI